MAYVQNERLQKDKVEQSVLGKLSERQKDLFTLLAAGSWHDTPPKLNNATQRLLSSQSPEKQWNLIQDWSWRWPGVASKQGVIQFLATGYASQHLPGGFTVFMFSPLCHRRPTDKRDRRRNIKGTFGKDGATNGYMRGLEIIERSRFSLDKEMSNDRRFMARFLNFLDVVVNTFCDDLAKYHTKRSTIESARRKMRGRMRDDIDQVTRDLHHGITPNLPLPEITEDTGEEATEPAPARGDCTRGRNEASLVEPKPRGSRRLGTAQQQDHEGPLLSTDNRRKEEYRLVPECKAPQSCHHWDQAGMH
jgi:hypothetical protein